MANILIIDHNQASYEAFHDFLENMKIIIILPDRERETIARGHSLHPRFLTFTDSDFGDVAAVINKMSMGVASAGSRDEELSFSS